MYTDDRTPSASDRRAAWVAGFLLAAVAGFYLARGMPWVHIDDLAFAGAGIDLARTGRLTNHTMDGWLAGFGTDKFYVQLPFHAYSLAAWIRLFGVGTTSFIAFQWVWYVAGGYGLVRVFGRFGMPLAMRLLLAIMFLTFVIQRGFRPEAEAFGLMFLGLSLLDTDAPFWRRLAALVLLGFSVLTYALVVGLAGPFAMAVLWVQLPPGTSMLTGLRAMIRAWLLPGMVAVAVVVASFLAMIRFDVVPFLTVFEAHRRTRAFADGSVAGFFRLVTEYHEALLTLPPMLLLVAAAVFVAVRWRQTEPRVRVFVCACVAAAGGCILLYATKAPGLVILVAFCAACSLASAGKFRRWRWPFVVAMAGLFAWNQSLWIVTAGLRRFPDKAVLHAVRDAALHSGKEEWVVDSSTARYVFDYQLPERTHFLVFMKPQWNEFVTMADKKAEACWVVSAPCLDSVSDGQLAVARGYPHIMVGHHEFKSLPLCSDEPVVLP